MESRKRTLKQVQPSGSKSRTNLDDKAERNTDFYHQDGFSAAYPKKTVYPPEGKEFQLEQLRARLPKYCPPPTFCPVFHRENTGCDDMDLTCITTVHPIMTKENATAPKYPRESNTCRPLQQLNHNPPPPRAASPSPWDELEQLCQKQQSQPCLPVTHRENAGLVERKADSTEEIGEVLEKMVLQKSVEMVQAGQKEKGCVTKLNFSDAESSLGTSSLMEDSVGGSLLGQSQGRTMEHSGTAGQSLEVFHDSWKCLSQNTSHGGRVSAFQTVRQPGARQFGKPLEVKYVQEVQSSLHESELSSFADSCNQSQSFQGQPSQSNMSSFSVYEDSRDQSSIVPFHDSWADSSKDAAVNTGQTDCAHSMDIRGADGKVEQEVVYRMVLGVPLEVEGMAAGNKCMDQSYTQIGIHHPKTVPSISTPVSNRIDLTWDMSLISQQSDSDAAESSGTQRVPASKGIVAPALRKRSAFSTIANLSTIKEESSKSSCSSNSTASSTTSGSASGQLGQENVGHGEVNPFLPNVVNMMLNALHCSALDTTYTVPAALPQLVNGRCVTLGQFEFSNIRKVTSGGFGSIFTGKRGTETKVLKVQKPLLKWEIAIIIELHSRLSISNLIFGNDCFITVEQSFLFDNASVMVLPHYHLGSLLDLANAHLPQRINELFVFYYLNELLEVVSSLHLCGILHADIKPDNFMLRDIGKFKTVDAAKGHGLCLLDFGRAVDLTAFSDEIKFLGSCGTEGFQCAQMLEGKPWKYEVDYFGIAATAHVLLTGQYMSVIKDPKTNLYRSQTPLPRSKHSLWTQFFECLLNTTQPLPLSEMAQEFSTHMKHFKDYLFTAHVGALNKKVVHYLTQKF